MRIDELKRIAEENNYIVQKGRIRLGVGVIILKSCRYDHPETIAVINNDKENVIFLSNDVCHDSDFEMIKAAIEFAETPLEDREEEKKFYLKHRYLQSSLTNSNNILCYSVSDDKLALWNGVNFPKYKTYLTLEEIEEIKEKFDTDLNDFELVEVEE